MAEETTAQESVADDDKLTGTSDSLSEEKLKGSLYTVADDDKLTGTSDSLSEEKLKGSLYTVADDDKLTGTSESLSEEKLKEYRNAFAVFDKDGSSSITKDELKEVLVSLGKNPSDEDVESMIAGVDKNGNGEVDFNEFIRLMEDEEKAFKTEDLMRKAFGVLDPDGDGYITVARLKRVVEELGCEFTDEEINEMMTEADLDGNGRVNYRGLIGLMSTEDETLATAYKKREKIEEVKREEIAIREAERIEKEMSDRESEDDNGGDEYHVQIPDMEEIASQFDNEQYDKFSRQVPVGGRVVKRPGKRLPMSRTRMQYLQRKNKSLSTEASNVGSSFGSAISLSEQEHSGHQQEFRTHFRPDSENWRGTIHDERQTFDRGQSRLLDPSYYLKKTRVSTDDQIHFEAANIQAISLDFRNELSKHQEMNPKTAKGLTPLRTASDSSNASVVNQQKETPQTYAEKAKKEKESKETKLYYAIWRTAFTKAIEKLRDNNKMNAIRLNTPELLKEQSLREEKEKRCQKYRPKQPHRMTVISPILQTPSKNIIKKSATQETKPITNRGSYTERLKKINSLETLLEKQEERRYKPSTFSQKANLAPLQKRGDVITRSGLNRILKIHV